MKRYGLSIKARITLWYAALLMAICVSAVWILAEISERAAFTYYSDTLRSAAVILMDEMEVEHGLLEIDDDLEDIPDVHAALFDLDGNLIYGRQWVEAEFQEASVRSAHSGSHLWYIHDTCIKIEGLEGVWLRVYILADADSGIQRMTMRRAMWLLPLLSAIALAGGYGLTKRAFRPVREMTELTASIAGGGDLSARLDVNARKGDELKALSDTLNDMLARLETAFEHERQFTADAAHELRTPLTAMRMQGEYALGRSDAQEKDEAIAAMLQKNEEMHALVRELLLLARLDTGQVEMSDCFDPAEMIAEIAQDMEMVAQEKGIALTCELQPLSLLGNRAMLARAVVNLLDNAIRYGREDGWVRVSLREEEGCACIRVEDNGMGFDEEAQKHAFERFWRADASRSTPGTGIGLSLVEAAVRAHGGGVSLQSEAGNGCRFEIRIPIKRVQKD